MLRALCWLARSPHVSVSLTGILPCHFSFWLSHHLSVLMWQSPETLVCIRLRIDVSFPAAVWIILHPIPASLFFSMSNENDTRRIHSQTAVEPEIRGKLNLPQPTVARDGCSCELAEPWPGGGGCPLQQMLKLKGWTLLQRRSCP